MREILTLALLLCGAVLETAPIHAGSPQKKVLIIGIDGCRPDALQAATTPAIDELISDGAVSYLAQTGDITVSGPGWSSLLTAVWRDKHGVDDNTFDGSNFDEYPHFFTRLKETCGNAFTASIVAWTPIQTEIVSDADWSLGSLNDVGVANEAVDLLTTGDPDVLFLHLDQVDGAGHGFGFSPTVPQYLNAIENVDDLVGDVMDAIESRDTFADESWLVLLSTDHGGIGTSHGGDTPEERTIFVIVSGSAAEQGALISPAPDIVDIPATVMAFLEVPIDPAWDWDGVPVGLSASPPPSEFPCVSCPRLLYIQADQVDKTVQLTWSPGAELDATALELYRAGELIATLALDTDEYLDTPPIGSRPAHEVFDYELRVVGGVDAAICAPLVDRAILSNGDVRLAEDFDDAVDDGDLLTAGWSLVDAGSPVESATWTIDNPAGRANPPEFDGSPTTGRFIISDSDFGGGPSSANPTGSGMSHDVWTPPFDCTGMTQVFVHFDCSAVLNNNGKAVFDIDVSTTGGSSWINVFRRVAPSRTEASPFVSTDNADGFFGRVTADIGGLAAGQPGVRVRVRHFEPSWDWWIALDNVIVDDVDLRVGGAEVILPTETFAAGIPADWTIDGIAGGLNTWNTNDPCARSLLAAATAFPYLDGRAVHRLATNFAILDSDCDPDPAEDEFLFTPTVDCSEYDRVFLHFRSEAITDGAAEVRLSLDGGASVEPDPVFSYRAGGLNAAEDPVYAERVIEVPGAAGEDEVALAFRYTSAGNNWFWAITDVAISGDPLDGFRRGDCNGDGLTDISDPVFHLSHLFSSGPAPVCVDACDTNDDGSLDLGDPIFVLSGLFGGPPPPAPRGVCGDDPTGDSLDCADYTACP